HLRPLPGEPLHKGRANIGAGDEFSGPVPTPVRALPQQSVMGHAVAYRKSDTVGAVPGDVPRDRILRRGLRGHNEVDGPFTTQPHNVDHEVADGRALLRVVDGHGSLLSENL